MADVTFPEGHPLRGQKGAVLAFLIRSDANVILFDTGIGEGNERLDSLYKVLRYPLTDELTRHGVKPADVNAIVNSHLHFDHCGNNRLFPGVPIYVQAKEYEAAGQQGYTDQAWLHFPEANYFQVDGDLQLANGLGLVSTPGHTSGHQSLLLDTYVGRELIAGQAIYSRSEYNVRKEEGLVHPLGSEFDPTAYTNSADRLIGLNANRVHFSHDTNIRESSV